MSDALEVVVVVNLGVELKEKAFRYYEVVKALMNEGFLFATLYKSFVFPVWDFVKASNMFLYTADILNCLVDNDEDFRRLKEKGVTCSIDP